MSSSLRFSFFSSLIFYMFLFYSTNASNISYTPSKLAVDFCNEAQHPQNCLIALKADPQISNVSNYLHLSSIILNLAIANTTLNRNYMEDVAQRKESKSDYVNILNFCIQEYDGANLSFISALMELKSGDGLASYDAKKASDGGYDCYTQFKMVKYPIPPEIKKFVNDLYFFSLLGFDAVNKVGST
ncbi:hypothetical protein ACFE04_015096 [Oxalis oulophora]